MESATSMKVGKSALFAFSLFLLASSAFASITVVSPKDGATVSLLKDAQREYLAQSAGVRRAQMADAAARAKFAKCGGRPASVRLEWEDDAFTTNAVYAILLETADKAKVDRLEVVGARHAEVVNLGTGDTYGWEVHRVKDKVRSKAASFKTAEEPRLLFIPGVANCRDLGGRRGLDGSRIRQGRVYRTAAYNGPSKRAGDSFLDARFVPGPMRITRAGRRELVEACGVKTDLDLRNEAECAGMEASPLGANVVWKHIPIRAYGWLENDKQAFGKVLKVFADEANYPIAFHCSGGRDRAGSLAFILEGLLGVPEDGLMEDWELSIFETDDMGFAMSRIDGLVEMLARYPGGDIHARIVSFVKACGLTDRDIEKIRAILLETK